jgi:hydrophobic/amphiphilic exporter-1 (mainly G- bacteria), HAE1 family
MGGIQGRLNKQFAVTIAIAMLVSAFNALTLTPALSAMLLRPSAGATGFLPRFYAWFNRGLTAATRAYVRVSHALVRKAAIGIAVLVLFGAGDYLLLKRLPTGFVPEEDYGYFLVNVQLPPAASLARTDDICRRIEQILSENHNVAGTATVAGFSSATPAVFRSGCRIGAGGRSSFSTRTSGRLSRRPGSGRNWPASRQSFRLRIRRCTRRSIATRP